MDRQNQHMTSPETVAVVDSPKRAPRPWNVTLVAVITFIIGLLEVIVGIALVVAHASTSFQTRLGLSLTQILVAGIVLIVVGVVVVVVSFGLFRGSRMARAIIALLCVVRIVVCVGILFVSVSGVALNDAAIELVVAVVVLILLYSGLRTKVFFGRER